MSQTQGANAHASQAEIFCVMSPESIGIPKPCGCCGKNATAPPAACPSGNS